jgi:hypothetical protein
MCDIDKIMDMLDWNESLEIQEKGRELAKNIRSINVFLQPGNPGNCKNVWDNCAKILAARSDETLKPYLIDMLEWLEDLNWPGALIILDRLKNYSEVDMLFWALEECVKEATALDKEVWLCNLSELLDNKQLKAMLPKYILEVLQQHYVNEEYEENAFEISNFESEFQENLHELKVTNFDLHFCSREELGNLINGIAWWNIVQTEEEKQKHLESIVSIREGYKSRYK